MKILQLTAIIFFSIIMVNGNCGKKPQQPPADQPITFTHTAGSNVQNPGSTLNFSVTLTSAMPASGIKVDISTKEEVSGTSVGNNSSISGSSATVNATVLSLPRQVWCIVTVTVSSVGTPSNTATQTFRVVYK